MSALSGMTDIAIVGATGAVGKEMISCLHSEQFAVKTLRLFASEKSAGRVVDTPFGAIQVEAFDVESVAQSRIVLMAVSGDFSLQYSRELVRRGCVVIDNSSAFRYDVEVPLIVPELNGQLIQRAKAQIIANPNCTTAILAMALFPIYKGFGVKRVIASTYQATSGAGEPGMLELEQAMAAHVEKRPFTPSVFTHNICNNVIPCIDALQDNGYTKEEMKLAWESRKILGADMLISCTAVRVPTMRAHCIAATVETSKPVSVAEVVELLQAAPGVRVVNDSKSHQYPLPATATNSAEVEVGRIRQSLVFGDCGIDIFVCGDQLLRGAALNAVRIALLC